MVTSFEKRVAAALKRGAKGVVVSGTKSIGTGDVKQRIEQRVIPGGGGIEEIRTFGPGGKIKTVETRVPEKLVLIKPKQDNMAQLVKTPIIREAIKINLNTKTGTETTERFIRIGNQKLSLSPKVIAGAAFQPDKQLGGRFLAQRSVTISPKDKRTTLQKTLNTLNSLNRIVDKNILTQKAEITLKDLDKLAQFQNKLNISTSGKLPFTFRSAGAGAAIGNVSLGVVKGIVKTVAAIGVGAVAGAATIGAGVSGELGKFYKNPASYTKHLANVVAVTSNNLNKSIVDGDTIMKLKVGQFLSLPISKQRQLINDGIVLVGVGTGVAGTYISKKAVELVTTKKGNEAIGEFVGSAYAFGKILQGINKTYKALNLFKKGSVESKIISKSGKIGGKGINSNQFNALNVIGRRTSAGKISRVMKPFPKIAKKLSREDLLRQIKFREKLLRKLARDKDTISLERGLVKLKRGIKKLEKQKFLKANEELIITKQLAREESNIKKLALKALRKTKLDKIKGLEVKKTVGARTKKVLREQKLKRLKSQVQSFKNRFSREFSQLNARLRANPKIVKTLNLEQSKKFNKSLKSLKNKLNTLEPNLKADETILRITSQFKKVSQFVDKRAKALSKIKLKSKIKESIAKKGKVKLTDIGRPATPLKTSQPVTKSQINTAKKKITKFSDIVKKETVKGGQLQRDGQVLLQKTEKVQKQVAQQVQKAKKLVVRSKNAALRQKLKRINKLIQKFDDGAVKLKQSVKQSIKLGLKLKSLSVLLAAAKIGLLQKSKQKQQSSFKQVLKSAVAVSTLQKQSTKQNLNLKLAIKQLQTQSSVQKQLQELIQELSQSIKLKIKKVVKDRPKQKVKIKDVKRKVVKGKAKKKAKRSKRATKFTRTLVGIVTGEKVTKKQTKGAKTGLELR